VRALEERRGLRSSWNLVPERYDVDEEHAAQLTRDGHELGVHGLRHDGRDLASARLLRKRRPKMRAAAARWRAVGFRAPATQRRWEWMPSLGFEYDSSYPDTDPYEPQPGGCCSWLPYFIGPIVELPITMPQDHTIFVILRQTDARIWLEKAEQIHEAGGMALVLTHPDYLSRGPIASAYEQLLTRFADDPSVWRALPIEVSRWWRRRARSVLQPTGDGWRVVGPAGDEATVLVTSPVQTLS
jgi:hypothetical protein